MEKRSYTKMEGLESAILGMHKVGKTNREIAEHFGIQRKQNKWWVSRYNRKQAKLAAGIELCPRGSARNDAQPRNLEAEQANEINRLKMENKLLRDFLR